MTSKKVTPPQQHNHHRPVLLEQVVQYLAPKPGESYLDLTAGYGGHTRAIIEKTGAPSNVTLVDRDEQAISALQSLASQGVRIIKSDFAKAAATLADKGERFDLILIDLGVSSPQLDRADRGFSFMHDGPLDMRMDQNTQQTAAELVNRSSETELAKTIRQLGEEPRAKAIAQAIVAARPLTTTVQLADVVAKTFGGPRGRIHPATRTFQALRMALNDELGQIKRALPLLLRLLAPGGRVAIISFHSLEDRLVKQFFKEQATAGYEAELQLLTKKPISGADYDVNNPRARSAKLRAAVKIKIKERASSHANYRN